MTSWLTEQTIVGVVLMPQDEKQYTIVYFHTLGFVGSESHTSYAFATWVVLNKIWTKVMVATDRQALQQLHCLLLCGSAGVYVHCSVSPCG